MRLFNKIALVIVGGAALSVTAISFFAYSFMRSALENSIITEQSHLTTQTLNQVDRAIYYSLLEIENISQDDLLESLLITQNKNSLTAVNRRLNEYTLTSGPWDILSLVDKNGDIIASTTRQETGRNIEKYTDSKVAFDKSILGEFYYSDAIVSDRTGKPAVIFSAPIRNNDTPNKEIIGVAMGTYSWQSVIEVLSNINGSEADLYNSNGVIIATNRRDALDLLFDKNYSDNANLASVIQGKKTVSGVEPTDTNLTLLSTYALQDGYLSFRGNGWVLSLRTQSNIAYSTARATATKLALVLSVLILVFSLPNLAITYGSVTKPINDLTNAVKGIAVGNLLKHVSIKSKDEVGQLAEAFNIMTDRLQKSYTELEVSLDEVKEKNKLLDQKILEAQELNKLMVGRELKMIELKDEIDRLKGVKV
jgi:HAMP domain-containing protein